MKNPYELENGVAKIYVRIPPSMRAEYDGWVFALVDVGDIGLLAGINCTWYANPARAPRGKFYVTAKRKGHTILMHRIIMGEPDGEVHHIDNDGLNNKRSNLVAMTHQENIRARWPDRDWVDIDAEVRRIQGSKRLIAIGNQLQVELGLTRQALWKIRTGKTLTSDAAMEYWRRVKALSLP